MNKKADPAVKRWAAFLLSAAVAAGICSAAVSAAETETLKYISEDESYSSYTERLPKKEAADFICSEEGYAEMCRAVSDTFGKNGVFPVPVRLYVGQPQYAPFQDISGRMFVDDSALVFPAYGDSGVFGLFLLSRENNDDKYNMSFVPLPAKLLDSGSFTLYVRGGMDGMKITAFTDNGMSFAVYHSSLTDFIGRKETEEYSLIPFSVDEKENIYEVLMQDEIAAKQKKGSVKYDHGYKELSEYFVLNTKECENKVAEIRSSDLTCGVIGEGKLYCIRSESGKYLQYNKKTGKFSAAKYNGKISQCFVIEEREDKYAIIPYYNKKTAVSANKNREMYISCCYFGKPVCGITSSDSFKALTEKNGRLYFGENGSFSDENWYFYDAEEE